MTKPTSIAVDLAKNVFEIAATDEKESKSCFADDSHAEPIPVSFSPNNHPADRRHGGLRIIPPLGAYRRPLRASARTPASRRT